MHDKNIFPENYVRIFLIVSRVSRCVVVVRSGARVSFGFGGDSRNLPGDRQLIVTGTRNPGGPRRPHVCPLIGPRGVPENYRRQKQFVSADYRRFHASLVHNLLSTDSDKDEWNGTLRVIRRTPAQIERVISDLS